MEQHDVNYQEVADALEQVHTAYLELRTVCEYESSRSGVELYLDTADMHFHYGRRRFLNNFFMWTSLLTKPLTLISLSAVLCIVGGFTVIGSLFLQSEPAVVRPIISGSLILIFGIWGLLFIPFVSIVRLHAAYRVGLHSQMRTARLLMEEMLSVEEELESILNR
jgi:hypothetical protein